MNRPDDRAQPARDVAGPGSHDAARAGGDPGRPLLAWVAPTRGYVLAVTATVLVTNGAGVVWQAVTLAASPAVSLTVSLTAGDGSRARGGAWLSIAAIVVLILGAGASIDRARRPRPPVRVRRAKNVTGPAPRNRQERREVRRAVWRGVLPRRRRLARIAAGRLAGRVSGMAPYMWMSSLAAGLAFGFGASDRFGYADSCFAALPGMSWTLIAAAALGQDWWLAGRADVLNRAFAAARDP